MRVLFVDDNAMNRRVIRSMLDAAGADMAEAEDAETGMSMIGAGDYDIILMDLRMPGVDGLSAIRRIRARADDKARLPVIVVTADNAHDIRNQVLAAGADDLLLKPVQMQMLFDAIGQALSKGDQRGALLA